MKDEIRSIPEYRFPPKPKDLISDKTWPQMHDSLETGIWKKNIDINSITKIANVLIIW